MPAKRRPSLKPRAGTSLEVLEDAEGSTAVGWVSDRVVYARSCRGLSASVGAALAARLESYVESVPELEYFADASELTHYDLMARSAFVRVVLANRRKFAKLLILTWGEGMSAAGRALVSVVGEPCEILTDSNAFHDRLLRAAPAARRKLDPNTWVHVALQAPSAR